MNFWPCFIYNRVHKNLLATSLVIFFPVSSDAILAWFAVRSAPNPNLTFLCMVLTQAVDP
jgi:hypothetical protein